MYAWQRVNIILSLVTWSEMLMYLDNLFCQAKEKLDRCEGTDVDLL